MHVQVVEVGVVVEVHSTELDKKGAVGKEGTSVHKMVAEALDKAGGLQVVCPRGYKPES